MASRLFAKGYCMDEGQRDFQEIYAEYYPKILGYVRRFVNGADAEDAAQEVFVKINQALGRFRGESSLATWIYRIATNTALDHLRKASSQKTSQLPEDRPRAGRNRLHPEKRRAPA